MNRSGLKGRHTVGANHWLMPIHVYQPFGLWVSNWFPTGGLHHRPRMYQPFELGLVLSALSPKGCHTLCRGVGPVMDVHESLRPERPIQGSALAILFTKSNGYHQSAQEDSHEHSSTIDLSHCLQY